MNIMEIYRKDAYIAAAGFLVLGILFTATGIPNGLHANNLVLILGVILDGLGVFGIINPKVGEVLAYYLSNIGKNQPAKKEQKVNVNIVNKGNMHTGSIGSHSSLK